MTTKAPYVIILLLSFALLFQSCEHPDNPVTDPDKPVLTPEITLGSAENHYGFEEGSDIVTFSIANPVEGEKVQVKSDGDWVKIVDISNSSFKFNYEENTTYSGRTATLTVSYGKAKPVTFSVCQQAAPVPSPVIKTETAEIDLDNKAGNGSFSVAVENPTDASLEAGSDADWLKVEVTSTDGWVVRYTYEANNIESVRTATITLSYGDAEVRTVKVEQEMASTPVITPETAEICLGNNAGNGSFSVGVENPTDALLEASSDADWLKVEVTSTDGWNVRYTYEANSNESVRTATITLSYGNAEVRTVRVEQEKTVVPVIELDFTTMNFGSWGGSCSIGFTVLNPIEGKSVTITTDSPEWVSIDYVYETSIQFGVWKNPELTGRQANIFFDYEGAGRQTLVVNQAAGVPDPEIILTTSTMEVGSAAGNHTFTFKITNPISGYEATLIPNYPEWISVISNDSSKAEFRVAENTGATERQGCIYIYYPNAQTQTFVITQKAWAVDPEIVLSSESLGVSPLGGSYSFSFIISNPVSGREATVTSDSTEWLTVTDCSNSRVEFSVTGNPGYSDRQGRISVLYDGAVTKTFTVTQKGAVGKPEILVNNTEFQIDEKGGNGYLYVSVVNKQDGAGLTASSNQSWLRAEVVDPGLVVKYTYDANTTDADRTAVVTLNYGDAPAKEVTFSQKAGGTVVVSAPEIVFKKASIEVFGKSGGYPFEISIKNPVIGVNATAKADCDWVSISSVSNDCILFSVQENSTGKARQATVIVSYSGAEDKCFYVDQEANSAKPVINPDPMWYTLSKDVHRVGLSCSIENPVDGVYPTVSYDEVSWVSVEVISNERMILTVKENTTDSDRSFNFTWKYPGADDVTVPITQNGDKSPKLTLENEAIVISKLGTAVIVPYVARCPEAELQYFTYDKPEWLNIGYNSTEKYFIIGAAANTTGSQRSTEVTVHAKFSSGVEATRTVVISQSAQDLVLTLNPSSVTRNYTAGTVDVAVALAGGGSGTVQFSSTGGWVSLTKYSTTSLTLTYDQNNSKSDRTATITVTYPDHAPATFSFTQRGNSDFPDGVVDLGLASGLLWATANIGADKTTAVGNYYAWGETSTKSSFSWTNYSFGTEDALTKYTDSAYQLSSDDDVAARTLGKGWRMPTNSDWLELADACDIAEATVDGVLGITATSRKTGQYIFLPYAGYKDGNRIVEATSCFLWASTRPHIYPADQNKGWSFFGDGLTAMPRYVGLPVRAVREPSK